MLSLLQPPASTPKAASSNVGIAKCPPPVASDFVDTGRAEGDDVGHAAAVNVRQLARVGVVAAPTAGPGTEGSKLERGRLEARRPVHRLVVESQLLHIAERVSAVRAGDTHAVAVERNERGLRTKSGEDVGVDAGHGVDGVVAAAALELVVGAVAGDHVVAGTADRVLDYHPIGNREAAVHECRIAQHAAASWRIVEGC